MLTNLEAALAVAGSQDFLAAVNGRAYSVAVTDGRVGIQASAEHGEAIATELGLHRYNDYDHGGNHFRVWETVNAPVNVRLLTHEQIGVPA